MQFEKLTIPHIIKHNADRYPNEIALREKKFGIWKSKTWNDCFCEMQEVALGLIAKGIQNNQVVGLIGNNTPRWLVGEIAIQSIRGIALGIYSDALESEIEYLITYSKCRAIFVEDEEQADKIISLNGSNDKVDLIIYDEPKGMHKYKDKRLISYEDIRLLGRKIINQEEKQIHKLLDLIQENDTCIYCPTSGTTSNPKLAMINHISLIKHAYNYLKADPKDSKDEYVSVLPMPWVMEQMYAVAKWSISRMKVNFFEDQQTMFDDLREIGPTFILLAPRVWEQIAADIRSKIMDSSRIKRFLYETSMKLMKINNKFLKNFVCEFMMNRWLRDQMGFSYLKSAATGGASLGPDTFKFFVDIGIPLRQLYGQTEQLGAYTIHSKEDINYDSVGYPFKNIDVDIDNPDKEGIGEIIVKNNNSMQGYLGIDKSFLNNGWFYTGDAGYLNEKGHLIVIDRMSDLSFTIENLRYSPQYIENKLKFSTYIAEAAVIGSAKPYLSSIICIRFSVLSKWAESKRIAFTTYSDLASKLEIEQLIVKEVRKVNATLPSKQKIKKFVLLYKEFDADDDELTRTKKLRRNFVINKYKDIVEAIYKNSNVIHINTQIKLQDGGIQKIKTDLKIIEMD